MLSTYAIFFLKDAVYFKKENVTGMYVMSKVNRVTQLGQIFLFVLVNNDKAKNEIAVFHITLMYENLTCSFRHLEIFSMKKQLYKNEVHSRSEAAADLSSAKKYALKKNKNLHESICNDVPFQYSCRPTPTNILKKEAIVGFSNLFYKFFRTAFL